ncbi:MAG TPA: capsule assembly Wzi family protein [Candidatus Acidoferrum sp.]|nr:capsule assembly Wzi family protein [Candidatus Acidoferrum sp.]
MQFIRHLAEDQQAIWTSPFRLTPGDSSWLFPLAATTAGFIATDPATARAISNDTTINHYRSFSNYGIGGMIAAGGGMYVWGKLTHDEHKRETGLLAGEAAIDGFGVSSVLAYTFQRERPYQDNGSGRFFGGGGSFPSDHAVAAWSIASVIAHEYPGPLTDLLAYGGATAISVSRVMGKEHYPSDVLVGSAIGWLIGREVYRLHHNPDLGGGSWPPLSGSEDKRREPANMGSPFVPLDSWIYPALDRLAALGYITTSFEAMKPWTRIECAHLVEEASENVESQPSPPGDVFALLAHLQREFTYEIGLFKGQENLTANVDSIYARGVSISGPALTDSYHFGQTVSYDFGRPFERGMNGQIGGSFSAAAGPMTVYVRTEYQHAPSAPALPPDAVAAIAERDAVPVPPDVPVPAVDQLALLDAYVGVNLDNWEISLGRQSVDWGPGVGGSLIWSDNIQPMNMARIVNPEPFELPGFLRFLGPTRVYQFFGRLEGHYYIRRPFMIGQKVSFKPLPSLELGFARTLEIGGEGPGATPLTGGNLVRGVFGRVAPGTNSVPGHSQSEFDWTFYVPHVNNYVVFYGDMYAADDPMPWFNPPKNPFRPGFYITRFPKISKLDLHIEAADTESPGFSNHTLIPLEGTSGNTGDLNYWNGEYRDGSTYNGFLIGNTVGRDGAALQGWLSYWLSPRNVLGFTYKNSVVRSQFIPGGGAWQDYAWTDDLHLKSGFYLKSEIQYEHISHYPILFNGPEKNVTAILELGFQPRERRVAIQGADRP